MTNFIKCKRGWVNMAHVASIRRDQDQRHPELHVLEDADGSPMGLTEDFRDWLDQAAPVVPAAPGEIVWVIGSSSDDSERPAASGVTTGRVSVVAWRIVGAWPEPILTEPKCSNEEVFQVHPDGRLFQPGVAVYENVSAAIASVLEDAQAAWDHANGATP